MQLQQSKYTEVRGPALCHGKFFSLPADHSGAFSDGKQLVPGKVEKQPGFLR